MPGITLTFSAPLNASCQVGDLVYYVTTQDLGGFKTNDSSGVALIGEIREIREMSENNAKKDAEEETPQVVEIWYEFGILSEFGIRSALLVTLLQQLC